MSTAEAVPPTAIQPIDELFKSDRVGLWATTYNLQLALFNEYLLRRLGDPPLNIAVLADRRCLDRVLAAIPRDRLDLVGPVNRRWLLRAVQLGTGRFHPKSYLIVTARTAKLLVGSGNLTTSGLDGGREVFTSFTSGSPVGDAAITSWRQWMRRLVALIGDVRLAERFADLEERIPSQTRLTVVAESPLWHNLDAPLADQFCSAIAARATTLDELVVTAPFYDETGEALARLAARLAPRAIRLYTATSTSVDGYHLVRRLSALGAPVEIVAYQPDRFTHAKLIGVTSGSHGWLLSGSPNLSHAALTLTAGPGNVELAVFCALSAEQLHARFLPLDTTAEPKPLESLTSFTYQSSPESDQEQPHVTILSGTLRQDGRAHIVASQPVQSAWRLADHNGSQPLVPSGTAAETVGPLSGPIVRLVDAEGAIISNRVVLDDPDALARILAVGQRPGSSRPAELTAPDTESPLGEALLWIHHNMVMDVTEQAPPGGDAGGDGRPGSPDDDDLWTRLEKERLGRDPRASIYPHLFGDRNGPTDVMDPLVELLEAMRNRAPATPPTPVIRPHPGGTDEPKRKPGVTWSVTARIRVRARNVLRRWAAAQTDPRLSWVNPLAPLGNLRAIASVFALLWTRYSTFDGIAELSAADLDDLWHRWFAPFVGTGRDDGWLDRLSLTPAQLARTLDHEFIENITKLCLLAIREGRDRRQRVIAWQPTLQAAFDRDLIDVTSAVTDDICAIVGREVTVQQLSDDLLNCLTFLDDALWCDRMRSALGLKTLSLEAVEAGQAVSVRLKIAGIENPLYDTRVPHLILAARRYRRADSIAIFSEDHKWRLVVAGGMPILYLPSRVGDTLESAPVATDAIEHLADAQGVLADFFAETEKTA
jgi:hypothetical protein